MAWLKRSGCACSRTRRLGERTVLTTYGFMTSPPLAMPAATIAICSGVAATSYWPMPDWASCGASSLSSPTVNRLALDGEAVERVGAEAELRGLRGELLLADLAGEGAERDVARHVEGLLERDAVTAAVAAVLVGQRVLDAGERRAGRRP